MRRTMKVYTIASIVAVGMLLDIPGVAIARRPLNGVRLAVVDVGNEKDATDGIACD